MKRNGFVWLILLVVAGLALGITIQRSILAATHMVPVWDELTDQADATEQPPEPPAKALKQRKWNRRTRYTRHTGGMADKATMDFLRIMVHMGKNHVISGGTGVGKNLLMQNTLPLVCVNPGTGATVCDYKNPCIDRLLCLACLGFW